MPQSVVIVEKHAENTRGLEGVFAASNRSTGARSLDESVPPVAEGNPASSLATAGSGLARCLRPYGRAAVGRQ